MLLLDELDYLELLALFLGCYTVSYVSLRLERLQMVLCLNGHGLIALSITSEVHSA